LTISIEQNLKVPLSGFKLCALDVIRGFASALTTIPDWTFRKIRNKQAGAELCQAHVKLGWPASSFSLQFKLFMSLKIGTYTLIKEYSIESGLALASHLPF
jgi:hypothetical protein